MQLRARVYALSKDWAFGVGFGRMSDGSKGVKVKQCRRCAVAGGSAIVSANAASFEVGRWRVCGGGVAGSIYISVGNLV